MKPGGYTSPDGRYRLEAVDLHEAERIAVKIYRVARDTKQVQRNRAVFQAKDVDGFTWIPKRPHTLVFAIGCVYGNNPGVYLWRGGGGPRTLRRPKKSGQHMECFGLAGVTEEGTAIIYDYWPDVNAEGSIYRARKRYGPFIKRMILSVN